MNSASNPIFTIPLCINCSTNQEKTGIERHIDAQQQNRKGISSNKKNSPGIDIPIDP